MSKIEMCRFRTARRLAHAGWTIYCRETGEGWYFGAGTSERRIRHILKLALAASVTDEVFFLADYTFSAKMEKWE